MVDSPEDEDPLIDEGVEEETIWCSGGEISIILDNSEIRHRLKFTGTTIFSWNSSDLQIAFLIIQ